MLLGTRWVLVKTVDVHSVHCTQRLLGISVICTLLTVVCWSVMKDEGKKELQR